MCIFGTVHFGNRFLWCVLGTVHFGNTIFGEHLQNIYKEYFSLHERILLHETGVNDEENLRRRLGDEKRSLFRDRITARKGERETRL